MHERASEQARRDDQRHAEATCDTTKACRSHERPDGPWESSLSAITGLAFDVCNAGARPDTRCMKREPR